MRARQSSTCGNFDARQISAKTTNFVGVNGSKDATLPQIFRRLLRALGARTTPRAQSAAAGNSFLALKTVARLIQG